MRHSTTILTAIILTTLFACSDSQFSDKNIELKAINIAEQLDSSSIKVFREWNFFKRGPDNWEKISGDSILYICGYERIGDTSFLTIHQPEKFTLDFTCNFEFDTATYWRFELANYNDTLVRILGFDYNGSDSIISEQVTLSNLFPTTNPFDKFANLSALKDSLGVYAIHSKSSVGDFITFMLSAQHDLTYLPDTNGLNPKYKDNILKHLATDKQIKKNWYLKKLEKPRDNG